MRWLRWGTTVLLGAGALALGLCLPATALAATASVSGTVYDDYAELGVQNLNAADGQLDNGITGITVDAYDAANALVGTATTGANGAYTIGGLPVGPVRIEVEIPAPYQASEDHSSLGGTVAGASANATSTLDSNERYLDDSSSPTGIDFGLQIPSQYSVTDPGLYVNEQWFGPTDDPTAETNVGIEQLPYSGAGAPQTIVPFSKIGTTSGLAVDSTDGSLFAAAYYKRGYGLLGQDFYPGLTYPTGAIYRVAPGSSTVSLFADVNAGPDQHPPLEANGGTQAEWFNDPSWADVGHEGWGSIANHPSGQNLYAVNLYDRSLYRFPLQGGSVDAAGQVQPASVTPIPDPGCSDGDWVPSALGLNQATGALYVGGVCTAATSQNAADLHAYVDLVSDPTGSPGFMPAFDFPLGYNRIPNDSQAYPAGSGTTDPSASDWEPWPTAVSMAAFPAGPPDSTRPQRATAYGPVNEDEESYPEIGGIAFDAGGNMLISLRDLMGDMTVLGETGGASPDPKGDLLKACVNGAGGWTLESGGACGGSDGFVPSVNGVPVAGAPFGVDPAVFGPIGPGDGYFFDPNAAPNESQPDTAASRSFEPGPEAGGVLQIPGFQDVVTDQSNVNAYGPGLVWDDDATGDFTRAAAEESPAGPPGDTAFNLGAAKANGIGDLAALASLAPVQIGNRVWKDAAGDCTEDAGDPGIPGVVVNLLSAGGANLATATTDSNGEYTFDIQSGTPYTLSINPSQSSLAGLTPTCADKAGVDPRITSKGVLAGGLDTASVTPADSGDNDFNYDFGFVSSPPLTPPARHRVPGKKKPRITLHKDASRRTARPGQAVTYSLTVHNPGSVSADHVVVCDTLPAGLTLVGRSKAKLTDGKLCFPSIRVLRSHRSVTFHLRVRVLRLPRCNRIVRNTAQASATGLKHPVKARASFKVRCPAPPPTLVTG